MLTEENHMKLGIIGSRSLTVDDLEDYIPEGVTEIISGGAKGVDACAQKYAEERGIKMTVFKPNYEKFGRAAPVYRNVDIVAHSDKVIAFWDGESRGTLSGLKMCRQMKIPHAVYLDVLGEYHQIKPDAEDLFLGKLTKFEGAAAETLYLKLTEDDSLLKEIDSLLKETDKK